MSRVGKRELELFEGVEVTVNGNIVTVKGPKSTLTQEFKSNVIEVKVENNKVIVTRKNEEKHSKQLHGTTNSLISSMIHGVSKGFEKKLIIKGVGYRAALKGGKIEIQAGYSHPVVLEIIKGVELEVPSQTEIIVKGANKQTVGQMAALIRDIRRPNVYSGKGIMYSDERVIRKEGKKAA
ncbi:MAG: 50S ribosomal protein L6 [Mollicutes bacterium PWAP]|nr:50S ribosomal protein L6 [Mollicutes bacterium PWAP]